MIPELRTFIAVARLGSFAAAGEQIGLTQSAVSHQIKRLEQGLGFELFERTGRAAQLNAMGAEVLSRAEDLVDRFERLADLEKEDAGGHLRVGAISSVHPTLLARGLVRFRVRYPNLRVSITPGMSMQLLDQLDEGHLDVAVIIRPGTWSYPELSLQSIRKEPYALFARKEDSRGGWRRTLEELPFIRYQRNSYGGRAVERFLYTHHIKVKESLEVESISGMMHMVALGLGVAIAPIVESSEHLPENCQVLPFGDLTFSREIVAVQRRLRSANLPTAHFINSLVEAEASDPKAIQRSQIAGRTTEAVVRTTRVPA